VSRNGGANESIRSKRLIVEENGLPMLINIGIASRPVVVNRQSFMFAAIVPEIYSPMPLVRKLIELKERQLHYLRGFDRCMRPLKPPSHGAKNWKQEIRS
jgi:hypothetical protein